MKHVFIAALKMDVEVRLDRVKEVCDLSRLSSVLRSYDPLYESSRYFQSLFDSGCTPVKRGSIAISKLTKYCVRFKSLRCCVASLQCLAKFSLIGFSRCWAVNLDSHKLENLSDFSRYGL
jgi:hypothetical protein